MKNKYLLVSSVLLFGNLALGDHRFDFSQNRQTNRIEDQKKDVKKTSEQVVCDNSKKDQECCTPDSKTSEEQKNFVEANC